uniref:Putative ATPase domain containing protein n=1 Tax=viral metagenome TaxID=1070528 RepID=A0A6M3JK91_9ZZZZ
MPRHGYIPIYDEDSGENVLVSYDDLDPELIEKLRMVPAIGGFCYAADDFLDLPLVPTPFYVGCGWLPRQGKAEVFAPPKAGKSFMCLQLARCIGSGLPFLGMPTKQGRVLYIQPEMAIETLQDRMKKTGQEYPDVYVGSTFSIKLDKSQGQEDLMRAVAAVEPDVLILDSLYKMISGDENETQDMEDIVNFIDEKIIDPYGCSVFITHHAGKDLKRGSRGSNVLESWVDAYIEMKKVSRSGEAHRSRITPLSMRHDAPGEPFNVELVDFEFALLGADDRPQLIVDMVRDYCEHHDEFKSSEIHGAGLGSRAPVQAAVNQLIEEGKIERFKTGWYRRTT